MARWVQKFGGSSLASIELIQAAAERVAQSVSAGHEVVVVVSAMQGETDRLLSLASSLKANPSGREIAAMVASGEQVSATLMALALQQCGLSAISLSGSQACIKTDCHYEKADIRSIDNTVLLSYLSQHVPVVTGYQGVNADGEVTTLGRGGSDLTAVAVAYAIGADECQIFTDVDGIYAADPRIVPGAALLTTLQYPEMLALAHSGAKVLQMRAVEYGSRFAVPIRVLSSFSDAPGTLIQAEDQQLVSETIVGLALEKQQILFSLQQVTACEQLKLALLQEFEALSVDVDLLMMCPSHAATQAIQFAVAQEDEMPTNQLLARLSALHHFTYTAEKNFAKVSLVGLGLQKHALIATEMLSLLAAHQVSLRLVHSSACKVSLMLPVDQVDFACPLLYQRFVVPQEVAVLA